MSAHPVGFVVLESWVSLLETLKGIDVVTVAQLSRYIDRYRDR